MKVGQAGEQDLVAAFHPGKPRRGLLVLLAVEPTDTETEADRLVDRLARYRIPSIVHTPEITSIVVEHPTADGPYGAKGVGEIVSIPTTPAITNAIYNAVGVRIDSLPVDQEQIAMELAAKK